MNMHSSERINPLLCGYGYWGKNLLRNIIENPKTGSVCVCDVETEKLKTISSSQLVIAKETSASHAIMNQQVNAVVIATPTSTHYELTKRALIAGKHVLVEKPFCTSTKQANELCKLAQDRGLVLMIDHIYLFNPVVRQLKEYVSETATGAVNYIDSTRINLGVYQKDTNVLWDLACHDVSIMNYLIPEKPSSVSTVGRMNSIHNIEDVVYVFLKYPSGLLVHINASWASPVKMRKMLIGAEKRMLIYDDIEPTNKLTIYDYNHNEKPDSGKSFLIDYRLGNITIPKCDIQEPLKNVVAEFYRCISTGSEPISSGKMAVETVRVLECAQQSLNAGGMQIEL